MKSKYFLYLKLSIVLFIISARTNQSFAQTTNGIFFQAVAKDNASNPAKNRKLYVQSTIIQGTATGSKVFIEEHKTNTILFLFSRGVSSVSSYMPK